MTIERSEISWLIIDWGTTNFRAFAMNVKNEVVDKKEKKLGLLQVTDGDFAHQLEMLLSKWLVEFKHLPIYMAGMIGSQQGWHDVAYQKTPVKFLDLANTAYQFQLPWGAPAVIFPGVCHKSGHEKYDVMRGEEVQLIGLFYLTNKSEVQAILPGTHSKHAYICNEKLASFSTYMTGELFSVLSEHTILGRGLPEQSKPKNPGSAFLRGVNEGQSEELTNTLFLARTHRLFNNIADDEVLEYLSGMLIGKELRTLTNEIKETDKTVYLVGNAKLCEYYSYACSELKISSTYIDGDQCFIRGITELKKVINHVSKTA